MHPLPNQVFSWRDSIPTCVASPHFFGISVAPGPSSEVPIPFLQPGRAEAQQPNLDLWRFWK